MKNAFAHNAFAASGGISQTAADARYARLASANTFTAAQTFSVNGAASTPPLALTGTIFTGGSATTTKPALLIEPTGTTSTGWSTAGTLFGGNAPSGFTGNLLDLQLNGASQTRFSSNGAIYIGGSNSGILSSDSIAITAQGNGFLYLKVNTGLGWAAGALSGVTGQTAVCGLIYGGTAVVKATDGSTGYGAIDAAGYQVGGVAGASGTGTVISAITVTNGIITSITVA